MAQFDPTKYLQNLGIPTDPHEQRAWAQGCADGARTIAAALNDVASTVRSTLPGQLGTAVAQMLASQADAVSTFGEYISEAAQGVDSGRIAHL